MISLNPYPLIILNLIKTSGQDGLSYEPAVDVAGFDGSSSALESDLGESRRRNSLYCNFDYR